MPPKKGKPAKGPRGMAKPLSPGIVVTDLMKKQWKLGPAIGQGGFGYIYLAGPASVTTITDSNAENVIKVEPHQNGPLFVELAFYQRAAKKDMISGWLKSTKKNHIGVPEYIATGSFENGNEKFRFLVMDRYGKDVQKIYENCGYVFPEPTVFSLGLRILEALEYIHEHEYCHADIKSSNLMLGRKKSNTNKVYLVDYGLAYRYSPNGVHVQYKEDPKRKHDGTIEYTSRDAHKGCAPARRGDLEVLGYCMIQWLCKTLPWENKLTDQDYVFKEKTKHMKDIPSFLKTCFKGSSYPRELEEYMKYVDKIGYSDKPDYKKISNIFTRRLNELGFKDDGVSIILPTQTNVKDTKRVSAASPAKRNRKAIDENIPESPRKSALTSPRKRAANRLDSPARKKIKSPVNKTPVKKRSPVKKTTKRQSPKSPIARKVKSGSSSPESTKRNRAGSPKNVLSTVRLSHRQNMAGSVSSDNSSECDKIDSTGRVIHLRKRRKNVQTVDFAQSP